MDLALLGLRLPGVPNHSLAALGRAARRAGFEARIVPFSGWGDAGPALEAVASLRPRVVGISIQTTEAALASIAFARLLRARRYAGRIVCGGHFATLNAEDILAAPAGVDAVVRLAGEEAMVGLLRDPGDAEMATLPGLVYRAADGTVRHGAPARAVAPETVASLAVADGESLPEHLGFPAADLVLSRGCEHRCAYCCVAATSTLARQEARRGGADEAHALYARPDVASVAEHLAALHRERGARVFHFMDDNVLPDGPDAVAAWATELREALDARRVPPVAVAMQMRADAVDEHSARALARLGLARAYVGVDGYSDRQLRVLGRRADADAGERAVRLLSDAGAFPICNSLLIGPTVPFDALRDELAGIARIAHAPVHLLPIDVRAGTAYHRRAEQRGLVEGGFLWRRFRFADERSARVGRVVTSLPSRLSERSVPIALYDLGYNLGIARRLAPDTDISACADAYFRIARAWNEDQVRVLRAAIEAARSGEEAIDALIAREQPRVRGFDRGLLEACDRELQALERVVSAARPAPVRSHARGRMLCLVAASMSLVGCYRSHVRAGGDAGVDAGPRDAGADAGPRDAGVDAGPADAGCPTTGWPPETPCLPFCAEGPGVVVEFDDEGRAVGFTLAADGGALDPEIEACLTDFFAPYCYPSLAGSSAELGGHCWVA